MVTFSLTLLVKYKDNFYLAFNKIKVKKYKTILSLYLIII